MAEDIKLYKYFAEQVAKMGKIKRAWFTTFNLDISFFEKYILSALVGTPYKDLNTPYDYETINANLANEEESLDGEKTEVRVFYDYRMLRTEGRQKQTSVHLHPVEISKVSNLKQNKFKDGVFHPKVVLLESYNGEYWLMVSSANLSLGGWSNNREAFCAEYIKNAKIGRELGLFFESIAHSVKDFKNNALINKLLNGKFGAEDSNWRFLSSFSNETLIEHLNRTDSRLDLKVWSPYFGDDLPELITAIQEEYFGEIDIIPAINEHQKIRITENLYNECKAMNNLNFKQDKLPTAAKEAFVHAKVWLTPKTLAIGSWNMTRAGMNLSKKSNNNIEAGIVYDLTPKQYASIIASNPLDKLKSPSHYKEAELALEKEELLDKFNLSIDLVLDWEEQVLKLQYPTYTTLIKELDENDIIKLPGFGKQRISVLSDGKINFRNHAIQFLTDRFFEIENKQGKILYKGYIREIGLASRPISRFENIDDYLKGWVKERPEDKTELHRLAYSVSDEFSDDLGSQTKTILTASDQNAWFDSFYAFECILNCIQVARKMKVLSDRKMELKKIGRVLPGSLSELKLHLEKLIDLYKNDKALFTKSPLYLWFLVEKANYVFDCFNEAIVIADEQIVKIKNLNFEEVIDTKNLTKEEKGNLANWKRFVLRKIKNADH